MGEKTGLLYFPNRLWLCSDTLGLIFTHSNLQSVINTQDIRVHTAPAVKVTGGLPTPTEPHSINRGKKLNIDYLITDVSAWTKYTG